VLRRAIHVVRYEQLCAAPCPVLAGLLKHCGLSDNPGFLSRLAARFHQPTYYRPSFKPGELAIIAGETAEAARRFGYDADLAPTLRQSAQ
ncbi:MAG TPA: hypothetical protein VGJ75_16345, partial [Dongiaceae bacterium]